jgi:N-glycosylase/DNA lyase
MSSSWNARSSSWRPLHTNGVSIALAPTLLSGMTFRWKRTVSGTFIGVLGTHAIELCEGTSGNLSWRCTNNDDVTSADALLRAHLRLDSKFCAYRHAHWQPPADEMATEDRGLAEFRIAAVTLPGVRVVRVLDLLECVIAFMGSANNNIKRNMQMLESLCAAFPTNKVACDPDGNDCFRFPTLEQLSTLSEEVLWSLGWGYRAPRLFHLVRELLDLGGDSYLAKVSSLKDNVAAARAALTRLSGVGRKVADCVLLFGYGADSVVPVDTHCFQLAQRFLLPAEAIEGKRLNAAVYDAIVTQWQTTFGAKAGHAFMVLFVLELADFRKAAAAKAAAAEAAAAEAAVAEAHAEEVLDEETAAVAMSTPARRKQRRHLSPSHEAACQTPRKVQQTRRRNFTAAAASPYFSRRGMRREPEP